MSLVLIAYITFTLISNSGNNSATAIKDEAERIKKTHDNPPIPPPPVPPVSEETRAIWEKQIGPVAGNNWVGQKPPMVTRKPPPIMPHKLHKVLPVPLLKNVIIEQGSVTIIWDDGKVEQSPGIEGIKPTSYKISRKKQTDNKDFEVIAVVDGNVKMYKDTKISPKTTS